MSDNISPRELLHERAQRKLMVTTAQAEHADGDRDPMWCSKAFYVSSVPAVCFCF